MNNRKFFSKNDLIIIIAILILSILLFVLFTLTTAGQSEYVQIIYDGNVIDTLPLDSDTEYSPDTNNNIIIEIKDGKVRFKSSDCPDKVCVNTGWLSSPGQTAVCLPNKISIVIKPTSGDKNSVDTQI